MEPIFSNNHNPSSNNLSTYLLPNYFIFILRRLSDGLNIIHHFSGQGQPHSFMSEPGVETIRAAEQSETKSHSEWIVGENWSLKDK